ncbi:hypothetical protein [Xenorhabdus anantnagensis]|uniref:Uncharacterized protein n=1 Tax=Xenorhabdus anantnagensis TaxID=3025875 RepID=A0ABT5LRQ5_9GAMM|nr:hypothetical protein [Xenorhabdus anantnagensis]MDC9597097.1 hypothetical protein [Xenorhabdus anantnagensis]
MSPTISNNETINAMSQDDKEFENALREISGDKEEYIGFDAGPRRDIGPRTHV